MQLIRITLFSVILVAVSFAQDFNFTGNGARAAAMGYAFTGVADDATAISWNTAGLTQLYSMEASIVGRLGFGSTTFSGLSAAPSVDRATKFKLNFASFVFPFNIGKLKAVAGVAFKQQFDFTQETTYTYSNNFSQTSGSDGGVNTISPSIAVQVNDLLSVGAAFNINTGSSSSYYRDSFGADTTGGNEDYSGSGIDIGLMLRPSETISIGANINLPHNLDASNSKFAVPLFYSIGVAFHASDNLLLAADFQSRPWSNSEDLKSLTDNGYNPDLNSIHIGMEYLLTSGTAVIPLRVGFFTNPLFQWDQNKKQLVAGVITFGSGLVFGGLVLDASYELQTIKYDYSLGSFGTASRTDIDSRVTFGATLQFGD